MIRTNSVFGKFDREDLIDWEFVFDSTRILESVGLVGF